MAKCEYCGEPIVIKRDQLMPMWNITCRCAVSQHACLEHAVDRHRWQAGLGSPDHTPHQYKEDKPWT